MRTLGLFWCPFFLYLNNNNMIYTINTEEQERYKLSYQETLLLGCLRTVASTSRQFDTIGGVEYIRFNRADIIGLPDLPRTEHKFSAVMCSLRNKGVLLYLAYNREDRIKFLID